MCTTVWIWPAKTGQLDLLYYPMPAHDMPLSIVTGAPTLPSRLGMAKLIGPGQPHAVSDVGCEPMLNTHTCQAFRFGTGGDMVDTDTSPIHQRCIVPITTQHPSIPENLVIRLLCRTVRATGGL